METTRLLDCVILKGYLWGLYRKKRQAGRAYWSLVDAYDVVVT